MDTTIEATQEILKDSPNGVLLDQDELSGWFGSMDKYSGARGAAKGPRILAAGIQWRLYTVNRITRGSCAYRQPVGVDPRRHPARADPQACRWRRGRRTSAAVHSDHAAPGRGRPGRGSGPGGVGLRKPRRQAAQTQAANRRADIMRADTPLKFDDGALKIREELEKKHLDLMQLEGLNRKLDVALRQVQRHLRPALRGLALRRARRRRGRSCPPSSPRPPHGALRTSCTASLKPHAVAFYVGVLGLSNDHDRLANVADYILARKLERITNRDVARGDRSMRGLKKHETEAIFEQLEALGWVIRTPGPRPSDPPHWMVNPVVHQKFAERAEAARKRREQDREMIGELLKHDDKT